MWSFPVPNRVWFWAWSNLFYCRSANALTWLGPTNAQINLAVKWDCFPESVARLPFHSEGLGVEACWGCVRSVHSTLRLHQASRSFVSRGRGGALWHSNMFHDVPKVVLWLARAKLLRCLGRWVAIFVAGAALWRPPSSFCVAGAAL